jgi:hypothetical protein
MRTYLLYYQFNQERIARKSKMEVVKQKIEQLNTMGEKIPHLVELSKKTGV